MVLILVWDLIYLIDDKLVKRMQGNTGKLMISIKGKVSSDRLDLNKPLSQFILTVIKVCKTLLSGKGT